MEALLVRLLGGFLRCTCAMYGPGMDAMEALLVRFCVDCIMPFFCAVQALYRIRDGRHGGVISALLCGIHYGLFWRCTGSICTLTMR